MKETKSIVSIIYEFLFEKKDNLSKRLLNTVEYIEHLEEIKLTLTLQKHSDMNIYICTVYFL